MKKLSVVIIFVLVSFLAHSQDVKPIDPINFKPLQSPSWSYYTVDSTLWIYKGSALGWTKVNKLHNELKGLQGGTLNERNHLSNSQVTALHPLQTISTSGTAGNITLSNSGGTLNLNVNDAVKYSEMYEVEVTVDGQTSYTLPFQLQSKTMVFYNGALLKSSLWTGVGTIYISIVLDTKIKDYIKIQN